MGDGVSDEATDSECERMSSGVVCVCGVSGVSE